MFLFNHEYFQGNICHQLTFLQPCHKWWPWKCSHLCLKRLTAQENNDAVTHWDTLLLQTHYIKNMAVVKKFYVLNLFLFRKERGTLFGPVFRRMTHIHKRYETHDQTLDSKISVLMKMTNLFMTRSITSDHANFEIFKIKSDTGTNSWGHLFVITQNNNNCKSQVDQ